MTIYLDDLGRLREEPEHLATFGDVGEGGICRDCGCTDERACPGGCWWVADDLCSTCWARESAR